VSPVPRVDAELVRRGLARSRGQAGELVRSGRVTVDGRPAQKPAMSVLTDSAIAVRPAFGDHDVGRGAAKLRSALDTFAAQPQLRPGPRIDGALAVDVGASTGGFTQVLLERGARRVVALDVGHGQLAASLQSDPRVDDRSGTNVRTVSPADLGGPFDLLVADLSFISLTLVLPDLVGLVRPGADLVLLVKPQFEVGRERLGKDGVVHSDALRAEVVQAVCAAAEQHHGLRIRSVVPSGVPGASGNLEFFLWAFRRAEGAAG
jgi:23S rRNA (cytidine1920-2'-O)/16S rRNA (cytidine1409-2'-O)-methyltransferase